MKTLRNIMGRPVGVFAVGVLALVACVSIVSYFWLPQDPNHATSNVWLPPSGDHWLGTDGSGRDIASRLLAGSRVSFGVALGTGALASLIGFLLALLGGLGKRPVREVVAVGIDVLVAFPTTLLAIMLTAVFGSGIPIVVAALGVAFGVSMGRVLRAEFRQVQGADFVVAAQVAGLSRTRILFRHLIPSVLPVYIVQVTWTMGTAVLAEASLSYLGFGAPKDVPSWGGMLASTQRFVSVYPETVLWPGLAITVTVLAFFLFGDQLRDALDMRDPADETAEVPR
ncbi:ABC transporter permease [Leucobacter aridicollis]|uniref:Peptide/nickel transport system permease protein n=1 Tax=Leucobacter aridicollis TaxID=283878 RepID=A0A852R194_9MICO|nr:ABC transporter permease [Leucobacter aridicollis]MBL3682898.1 ABC transporter permease [Leucobacter aridicollis]NYD26337.1 peptide/nickel transport system permease protein [Leucobacter aridicollis]